MRSEIQQPVVLDEQWQVVSIAPELDAFTTLKAEFEEIAAEARVQFDMTYAERFQNLDQLIESAEEIGWRFLVPAYQAAIRKLIGYGFYDIDPTSFYEQYAASYDEFTEACAQLGERYADIVNVSQERDADRVARREGRGKFIGGGFGLGGAVKGMATAGAANLAVGTLYATFNGMAKLTSMAGDAAKKHKLFTEPTTKRNLLEGVFGTIASLPEAIHDVFQANGKTPPFSPVSQERREAAERVRCNLEAGLVPAEQVQDNQRRLLELNPYDPNHYQYLLETLGDQGGRFTRLADRFGVNLDPVRQRSLQDYVAEHGRTAQSNLAVFLQDLDLRNQYLGNTSEPEYLKDIKGSLTQTGPAPGNGLPAPQKVLPAVDLVAGYCPACQSASNFDQAGGAAEILDWFMP